MDGEAHHEPAAGSGPGAEPGHQSDDRVLIEVRQQALTDEERRRVRVVAGSLQHGVHVVVPEVGRSERRLRIGFGDRLQPTRLVVLGRRMIDLDEVHAGGAEAQRAIVVPGAENHDLAGAPGDGGEHRVVEEGRTGAQRRNAVLQDCDRHALAETLLGIVVAARGRRANELRARDRDSLTRARRGGRVVVQVSSFKCRRSCRLTVAVVREIDQDAEGSARVGDGFGADPGEQLGIDPVDGGTRGRGRDPAAFRQPEGHAPPVVGVGGPIEIAPDDQGVDDLAAGLFGNAEPPDDVTQRRAGPGDAPEYEGPVSRHVAATDLDQRSPDRGAVGRPGRPEQRGERDAVVPALVAHSMAVPVLPICMLSICMLVVVVCCMLVVGHCPTI